MPYGHNYGIASSAFMENSGTGSTFEVLHNHDNRYLLMITEAVYMQTLVQ